jgi:PAS domain-containing protein
MLHMSECIEESAFLPSEVAPPEVVTAISSEILAWPPLPNALESIPQPLLLFNEYRQVVYANRAFLTLCDATDLKEILGKRFGEALRCVNLPKAGGGCGTGFVCRNCKVANAILTALRWGGSKSYARLHVLTDDYERHPSGIELLHISLRMESVIVGNHRLLLCVLGAYGNAPLEDPVDLASVPLPLRELYQLVVSGGPFCPY